MAVRTLRRLGEQSLPSSEYEIILVDDASDDDTLSKARALESDIPNLRIVPCPSRVFQAQARNIGVNATTANHLLFTDDDCIPTTDWVTRMEEALEREAIVAGAVDTPARPYFAVCHNVAEFHGFLPCQRAGEVDFIAGANMGIRREVLARVGGFRQDTPHAEDIEFVLRARQAGFRIWFLPEAAVMHNHNRTRFADVIRYAGNHAESTILIRLRYSSLLSTPSLLRHPFTLILAAPFIAAKVTAGAFLRRTGMLRFWATIPVFYLTKIAWCMGAATALRRQRRGAPTA